MATTKNTTCGRCGSRSVAWVQSQRTGRYYLAFATHHHSVALDGGQRSGETGWVAHPQNPHKCDDVLVGGFNACPNCGKHHFIPMGLRPEDLPAICATYPDAR